MEKIAADAVAIIEESELRDIEESPGQRQQEEMDEEIDEEEEEEHLEHESETLSQGQRSVPSASSGVPVLKNDGLHTYGDALVIIQNARATDKQVTLKPPCRPLFNGQVYVYALQEGQSPYDWRFDGFQWQNLRANSFPKKGNKPVISRHEFRLLDDGRPVDFYRHEYHEYGQKFKTPISLESWKYPFIVIHYFGNYPVNEAVVAAHGNRRSTIGDKRMIVTKTKKGLKRKNLTNVDLEQSAVESIMGAGREMDVEETEVFVIEDDGETVSAVSPSKKSRKSKKSGGESETVFDQSELQVYETIGIDGKTTTFSISTINAINALQVSGPNYNRRCGTTFTSKNAKAKENYAIAQMPPLTKDDLFGCYLFQESLGPSRVIRALDFTNGSNIIICENNFLKHVNSVLSSEIVSDIVRFSYNSTAKLYRFSVSTLFIRHPIFENEPLFPVAVFLYKANNKESHSRFFKVMRELIPTLNTSLTELTVSKETSVLQSAKEEFPENGKIISLDIKAPRVSSAKLDHVLVSVARSPNFDHVKMIHLIYFMQCYFLNEIIHSLMGNCEGDLLIQSKYDSITCDSPNLAERLLPSGTEEIEDALSPSDLITMLSRNPPVVLGSGSDYESCSRNELQLFEGLAYFFLAKDRMTWRKDRALFTVRGLGGVVYNVKLSDRTCSCMRGKACEHVLAVLIGTGLLARQS